MTENPLSGGAPLEGDAEPDLDELEQRLGVGFVDRDLLRQALVHKSLTNEMERSGLESNERL